jgi:rhamnulokinase
MDKSRAFAVDLGASGGKCFVGTFDDGSFSMEEISRFDHESVTFFVEDSSGTVKEKNYWDDILLYNNIVKGLLRFRREVSDRLDGVGIDTWGTDGGIVTPEGDIIGKIYCYRDHRLDSMIDEVKRRIDPARIYEITGIHFQPFNISNQLLWFMLNRKHTLSPGCTYLPMPTIFNYYIGGIKKVDSTWASVTQLMDCHTKQWSREILDILGVPYEIMPQIVEPGTVVGALGDELSRSVGVSHAPIIAVGAHDTASAYAAAPVTDLDEALIISSGTWSLVGKLIPRPVTSPLAMENNISNEGGIGNIRFLKNCMGLWIAQELRRKWQREDGKELPWEELVNLVRRAEPFTAFIDPDDLRFYNPADMEKAVVDFLKETGQHVTSDRGTLLRIVYESLALTYRFVSEQLSSACGRDSKVVHIVGGGCKNEVLNQFTSDALCLPVFAGPDEATACGNLMAQAMALGIIPGIEHAAPLIRDAFSIKCYKPSDRSKWERVYQDRKTRLFIAT